MADTEPALAVAASICSIILIVAGTVFFKLTMRGMGTRAVPYVNGMPPEESLIGPISNFFTGIVYTMKAIDYATVGLAPGMFALTRVWYLDYLVSCPFLILELAITLQMPGKIVYFTGTALVLMTGIATFTFDKDDDTRFLFFGVSLGIFLAVVYALVKGVSTALRRVPEDAAPWLRMALGILAGMWPLFPLLWLLGFQGFGVMDTATYITLHMLLDIACKGVYCAFLMRFRMLLEDHELAERDALASKDPQGTDADVVENMARANTLRSRAFWQEYSSFRWMPSDAGDMMRRHAPSGRSTGGRSQLTDRQTEEPRQEARRRDVDPRERRRKLDLQRKDSWYNRRNPGQGGSGGGREGPIQEEGDYSSSGEERRRSAAKGRSKGRSTARRDKDDHDDASSMYSDAHTIVRDERHRARRGRGREVEMTSRTPTSNPMRGGRGSSARASSRPESREASRGRGASKSRRYARDEESSYGSDATAERV
jgi:bacteriorhodopsin